MRELRAHFIISSLLTIIFILPDIGYNFLYNGYFDLSLNIYREFLIFFVINFLILSIPNLYLKFFLYSIFIFFISVEHLHYSFFHSLIMPYEINMFIDQPEEVFESLFGIAKYILIELLSLIFLLCISFFIFKSSLKSTLRIKYIPLFFILFILFTGTLIASQSRIPNLFYPKNNSTSIRNFYTSFSWWLGKDIITSFGNSAPQKKFQQYKLNHIKIDSPNTIIVVMGESLGAKYMSLYGFSKKTTPKLDKLKSNLLYTWGYSGGVETKVSVPTFFKFKREPENTSLIFNPSTNLFKIAKDAGYTTHYVTTQKLTIMENYFDNSVDHVVTDFSNSVHYDEVLVNYLNKIDTKNKNFIVLHQRNSHSPYVKSTPKEFYKFSFNGKPYQEYMQNSYYNSILYNDFLYDKIIDFATKNEKSTAVFFTSDHSEMIGNKDENGRYGHTYLGLEDAKIPMIIYLNKEASRVGLKNDLSLNNIISHYQFGKLIAKSMGVEVVNPNENNEYYINGIDISGQQGFLKYKKREAL